MGGIAYVMYYIIPYYSSTWAPCTEWNNNCKFQTQYWSENYPLQYLVTVYHTYRYINCKIYFCLKGYQITARIWLHHLFIWILFLPLCIKRSYVKRADMFRFLQDAKSKLGWAKLRLVRPLVTLFFFSPKWTWMSTCTTLSNKTNKTNKTNECTNP